MWKSEWRRVAEEKNRETREEIRFRTDFYANTNSLVEFQHVIRFHTASWSSTNSIFLFIFFILARVSSSFAFSHSMLLMMIFKKCKKNFNFRNQIVWLIVYKMYFVVKLNNLYLYWDQKIISASNTWNYKSHTRIHYEIRTQKMFLDMNIFPSRVAQTHLMNVWNFIIIIYLCENSAILFSLSLSSLRFEFFFWIHVFSTTFFKFFSIFPLFSQKISHKNYLFKSKKKCHIT